jgi:hypothetical protein
LLDSAAAHRSEHRIFSSPGASAGVGFAVSVETVNRVIPQLIASGRYALDGNKRRIRRTTDRELTISAPARKLPCPFGAKERRSRSQLLYKTPESPPRCDAVSFVYGASPGDSQAIIGDASK